jgi:rhodanese-related sulfurtransferase
MRTFSCAVALLWGAFLGLASPVVASGLTTIDGKELETMMADGQPLVIVDVREPELFAAGRINGAINIPFEGARLRIFEELSPRDRVVFVCHGGPMGDELGHLLAENGYPTVFNLKGGMKKWRGTLVH